MTKKRADISVFLAILFGPFGMFYWGIKVGFASLLGTGLFILLTTYFHYGVNLWYQILIRVVFLIINLKFLNMKDEELENLSSMGIIAFMYMVGMVVLNFVFFGFIGFVIWSILGRL